MKIKISRCLTALLSAILMGSFGLGGCSNLDKMFVNTSHTEPATETITTAQGSNPKMSNLPRLEGKATVELTINGSPVTIEVDGDDAPITAGNFVDLVKRGFYNGLTFHRVVKDPQPFVAQGGDPKGTGTGSFIDPKTSKPRYIPLEIKLHDNEVVLKHSRGAVAMARSQAPDSASSQFYFALSDLEFLDGDYAVFGYVTSGMDVVDGIKQGDRIQSAKVVQGLENLKE